MPKPLTADELVNRARAELDIAHTAWSQTERLGRTAPRTTRLRAAKRRARALLLRAIRRGLSQDEAKRIYETAPPDPEFGAAEWWIENG
jgi:hypothetical protein